MNFKSEKVLAVLALALDNSTPNHHIEYLLKKLYGLDGLSLDRENSILFERIKDIAQEIVLFI